MSLIHSRRGTPERPFWGIKGLHFPGYKFGATDRRIWRASSWDNKWYYTPRGKRITQKWIRFGSNDSIYVRHDNGEVRRHGRWWRLDFLTDVMLAHKFDSLNSAAFMIRHMGVGTNKQITHLRLNWAVMAHWPMVKKYVAEKHKIDLGEVIHRHDKNTQFAEKVRDTDALPMKERLEAANLAGRELGRLINVTLETEKRDKEKDDFESHRIELLETIREAKTEPGTDPGGTPKV